ncbi:MAG TPA: DUF559 domain-containing protein [Burkholderiaceae bacterium]
MSGFERFRRIREQYAIVLPDWLEEYQATGNMYHDPYFSELAMIFTPIENAVWSDIRTAGMPFYPQIPALNYFLDFACPMLKIAIECDGKAWHDFELDAARDKRLAAAGWMVFRIEGHECLRFIDNPFADSEDDDFDPESTRRWFMETSEGVVSAIKHRYFADPSGFSQRHAEMIDWTLFNHRSTPDTHPVRRPQLRDESGPVLLRDSLAAYLAKIYERAGRVAAAGRGH